MDKWAELRTAYHVARLGTVSAAADLLGFHRATVNRHIDALEAELGGRLFIRHARGYTPTELGEEVLRVAQKTEDLISDLAGRVKGANAQIEGEIKLTLLAPFAGLVMEAVGNFSAQNPSCVVHIDVSEDLARLEYGEAHIALRAGAKPDHPDYVVSSFGRVNFNLFAHESYVARHGLPKAASDLEGHRFIVPDIPDARVPFASWIKAHIRPDMVALSSRDVKVIFAAITEGIGMGFMGEHEVGARDDFHRVLPHNKAWSVPLWLVTHVDLHRTQKVQAMIRCIKSARPES